MAATSSTPLSFQDLILRLHAFWRDQGCVILEPYDLEMGAGTLHPATVLRALGREPWRVAYVQPCRRPADGRFGDNPNRLRQFHQYQVLLKPNPADMQEVYLASLAALGIDPLLHDVRFVEDDWENPTVGAWGLGWQVDCDGLEVSQYTYFQQVGGLDVRPVSGELTYGLERLAMVVQGVSNVFDLAYNDPQSPAFKSYGQVFLESERQFSAYEQDAADVGRLRRRFEDAEAEARALVATRGRRGERLTLPAYDCVLRASHLFNLLDARGAISVAERQSYIGRVRDLARACAEAWVEASP